RCAGAHARRRATLQCRPPRLSFPPRGRQEVLGMVTRNLRIAAFIVIAAVGLAPIMVAPAFAADPLGTWLTGDKKGRVRIVNCGGGICGSLGLVDEPLRPPNKKAKNE